jgi:CheY-like chemotaxis protein
LADSSIALESSLTTTLPTVLATKPSFKILVVDDSPINRKIVIRLVSQAMNFCSVYADEKVTLDFVEANDGVEAIKLVENKHE